MLRSYCNFLISINFVLSCLVYIYLFSCKHKIIYIFYLFFVQLQDFCSPYWWSPVDINMSIVISSWDNDIHLLFPTPIALMRQNSYEVMYTIFCKQPQSRLGVGLRQSWAALSRAASAAIIQGAASQWIR